MLNKYNWFFYLNGNNCPNLKCFITGNLLNTSTQYIFIIPIATLFQDLADEISLRYGELYEKWTFFLTYLIKSIQFKYI